jgi:hypothetical protein
MTSCVKPSANTESAAERMRAADAARAARRLNLMKETLTVRRHSSPALQRGDRIFSEYVALLEHGTDEDVWAFEVMRGAAIRWDIIRHRALHGAVEPTQVALWANAERLRKSGEIKQRDVS